MAALAREGSLDKATKVKGGDLGFVTPEQVPPPFRSAVLALKPGEMTPVLSLADGFHVIRLEESLQRGALTFEEARPAPTDALLGEKINAAWPGYLAELRSAAKIVPAPGAKLGPPKIPPR